MYADLWGWFHRFAAQAALNQDPLRQRLPRIYDQGWRALRAEDSPSAHTAFAQGLALAQQLKEPCWELFFEYWIAETFVFYDAQYKKGLDHCIKIVARAHQPRYEQCPIRSRVYYTLLYLYYLIDAIGYEEKIREMAEFIQTQIPMDFDTELRIYYVQAALEFDLEAYDKAEEATMMYLGMSINSTHRKASGYNLLRRIAFARGEIGQAFDYAYQTERNARDAHLENSVAHAMLWQAAYAQRLGDSKRAQNFYSQGVDLFSRYDLPRLSNYYDAVCDYLEQSGEIQAALDLRHEQIQAMSHIESIDYHCDTLLQGIRLLGRCGEKFDDLLAEAYRHAQTLIKPERYIQKLKQIESGSYFRYSWQE